MSHTHFSRQTIEFVFARRTQGKTDTARQTTLPWATLDPRDLWSDRRDSQWQAGWEKRAANQVCEGGRSYPNPQDERRQREKGITVAGGVSDEKGLMNVINK